MEKIAERRSTERHDTFIVRTPTDNQGGASSNVATIKMPDGKTVHALKRSVFDSAVRNAFKEMNDIEGVRPRVPALTETPKNYTRSHVFDELIRDPECFLGLLLTVSTKYVSGNG